MNTIYLVSHAVITGPINQALNILTGLKLRGNTNSKLVTFHPEAERSWLNRFKENGVEFVQLNPNTNVGIRTCAKQLKQYVEDNHVDVVHASGFSACLVAMMGCGKAKVVITQRCYPYELTEELPKLVRPFITHLYFWMIKRVDERVACSFSMQRAFKEQVNIDMKVVQNGVNTDYFKPVDVKTKRELRQKLQLPEGKRIYLALGVLLERKNNALIIDAFKKIQNNDSIILFVGAGQQEKMLKEKACNTNNIVFAGSTSKPLDYLQAADILVSSSLAEGLPNTVLEAMACGLPTILSDIEPHKELIEGTTAGVLFKNNDVEDLYRAILNSQSWDLDSMSSESRTIAENQFSIQSLAEKYEKVYSDVLRK